MSLKEEDRYVLVALELEKADKTVGQMRYNMQGGEWEMVANRLYYALFHAVCALLINDKHEVETHRGAINKFRLFYVKEGVFTNEEGKLYSQLQSLREDGDYNCSIDVDQDDVEGKVTPTLRLIEKIKQYIANNNV